MKTQHDEQLKITTSTSQLETAGALFGVLPEAVTRDMLKRTRVVMHAIIHSAPETGRMTFGAEPWVDCPNCKQSATGKYGKGSFGCNRCGWCSSGHTPTDLFS